MSRILAHCLKLHIHLLFKPPEITHTLMQMVLVNIIMRLNYLFVLASFFPIFLFSGVIFITDLICWFLLFHRLIILSPQCHIIVKNVCNFPEPKVMSGFISKIFSLQRLHQQQAAYPHIYDAGTRKNVWHFSLKNDHESICDNSFRLIFSNLIHSNFLHFKCSQCLINQTTTVRIQHIIISECCRAAASLCPLSNLSPRWQ